jgi:RNA polymerase sigma-70 factor (ECF subfamily)
MVDKIKKAPKVPVRNGEDALIDSETRTLVREAVEKLPEKLKSVLVLKEYADLNYKQISGILHISESNVKVRVHRARKIMESMLDREEMHVS